MGCGLTAVVSGTALFSYALSIRRYMKKPFIFAARNKHRHWTSMLLPNLICMAVAMPRVLLDTNETCPGLQLDPDIGGIGVLVGIYSPVVFVVISLTLVAGMGFSGETGTKELGMAILANMVYLTFNLLKAELAGDLSLADLIVALITVEASSAGVSMTLSNKYSLAARTYVCICHFLQLMALLAIAIALGRAPQLWWNDESCCVQQVWWSLWSTCSLRTVHLLPTWAWLFLHVLKWNHRRRLTLTLSTSFDRAKKNPEPWFREEPATVVDLYLEEIPGIVVNFASLIRLLLAIGPSNTGKWSDWGQSATLVITLFGFCHWMYAAMPARLRHLDKCIEQNRKRSTAFQVLGRFWHFISRTRTPFEWLLARTKSLLLPEEPMKATGQTREALIQDLVLSAALGDIAGVEHFIASGAPVNGLDEERHSALYAAVANNHEGVVHHLLRHGAQVAVEVPKRSARTYYESSAIHVGIKMRRREALAALLKHIDKPKHPSVWLNVVDCMAEDEDEDYDDRLSPLVYAISLGNTEAMAMLLSHGASPSLRCSQSRQLPLVQAAKNLQTAALALLCCYLPSLDIGEFHHPYPFQGPSSTALHTCAAFGKLKNAELLLDLGADTNIRDRDGALPLHTAATEGHHGMLAKLASVSDIDARVDGKRHVFAGLTALEIAVQKCDHEAITILVRHGASIIARRSAGQHPIAGEPTALGLAIRHRDADAVRILLATSSLASVLSVDKLTLLLPITPEIRLLLPAQRLKKLSHAATGQFLWHSDSCLKATILSHRRLEDLKDEIYLLQATDSRTPSKTVDTLDIRLPRISTSPFGSLSYGSRQRDLWRYERTFFHSYKPDASDFWADIIGIRNQSMTRRLKNQKLWQEDHETRTTLLRHQYLYDFAKQDVKPKKFPAPLSDRWMHNTVPRASDMWTDFMDSPDSQAQLEKYTRHTTMPEQQMAHRNGGYDQSKIDSMNRTINSILAL